MANKPIGSFYVQLGLNTQEFRKNLTAAQRDLRQAFGSAAIDLSNKLAASMAVLTGGLAAVGAASVKLAADLESQRKSFERLLGSADAADKKLRELQDFAARTPFTFTELTDYTKRLLALGFAASEVKPIMTTLGDAASGLGLSAEGMGRLIKALGDIKAKGVLATQEMKQFGEAGVAGFEILANQLGITVPELMEKIEDRAIDSATAITALTTGLNQRFGGMMEIQSNTTLGLWSSIRDEVENIMRNIGQSITESVKLNELFKSVRDGLQQLREQVEKSGLFSALWNTLGEPMRIAIVATAGAITGALIPAIIALKGSILIAFAPLTKPALITAGIALIAYAATRLGDEIVEELKYVFRNATDLFNNFFYETFIGGLKKVWITFGQLADEILSLIKITFTGIKALTWDLVREIGRMMSNPLSYSKLDPKNGPLAKGIQSVKDQWKQIQQDFKWPEINKQDPGNAGISWLKRVKEAIPDIQKAGQEYQKYIGMILQAGAGKNKSSTPGVDADGTKSAINKLAEDAKSLSESIERDWINATKTKQEQLDYEYQKELENLQKSKSANENYLRDLQRMTEVYSKRGFDIEKERLDKIRQEKVAIAESEYTYLQQQIEDEAAANNTRYENHVRHLEEKDAAYRAHLEGQRNLTEIQNQLLADANRTSASYMAEGYRTLYYGLSDAFTNIITGAKSAGEAFKQLGMQLIQMVVRWMVQRKLAAVMSKSLEASQTAASVAQAAAISAAWAPAAAMVAAATFGASTAAAGAGLTGLSVLSRSLAMPGLAEGGIVTKPTLAWVGEGRESEAVIPLSRLENMVGSGGGVQINVVNNSGVPVAAKATQRMDGGKTVIDLFIDGYTRNVSGIQDIIGGK